MEPMRVLLVDDEPELVFTMAERLELRGYDVDAVTNGPAAIERVRSKIYDVMVVDVKMPGMSGEALLNVVRQEFPSLPVIMLTGHGSLEEGTDLMEHEACAYLYKPINLEELIKTLEDCVKH